MRLPRVPIGIERRRADARRPDRPGYAFSKDFPQASVRTIHQNIQGWVPAVVKRSGSHPDEPPLVASATAVLDQEQPFTGASEALSF